MAVIAKQRYKLDIAPKGGWVIVYASQHDDGAREIEFAITNQGNTFSIPASINVSVQGIKVNGSYFSHSCSYSGNIVKMALADDMTDIVGKAICVLKFTNSSQQKLATAKFILNVDSDSSSEGVIIDTEAEEIFNQMLNEIRAQAASISADIAELQSMVGSPLVASTVSGMTDHNKIYVYIGSESGYTNGNWYYWNGSAWTSGGVYNAVAINIDSIPTQGSTNAVQSGGVQNALDTLSGDINDLKSCFTDKTTVLKADVSDLQNGIDYSIVETEITLSSTSGKSINANGEIINNGGAYLTQINVGVIQHLKFKINNPFTNPSGYPVVVYVGYDGSVVEAITAGTYAQGQIVLKDIPANVEYTYINSWTANVFAYKQQYNYSIANTINNLAGYLANAQIEELLVLPSGFIEQGAINDNGFVTDTLRLRYSKITKVKAGDKFVFKGNDLYGFVAARNAPPDGASSALEYTGWSKSIEYTFHYSGYLHFLVANAPTYVSSTTIVPNDYIDDGAIAFKIGAEFGAQILKTDDIVGDTFISDFTTESLPTSLTEFNNDIVGRSVIETFAFMTDSHIVNQTGSPGLLPYAKNYINYMQSVYNASASSFFIYGGDTLGNSDTPEIALNKLIYFDGFMNKKIHDYLPVVGNHDMNEQGTVRLTNSEMLNSTQKFRAEGKTYYKHKRPQATFYFFNTGVQNEAVGAFQNEQLTWFATELLSDNGNIIPVVHILFATYTDSTTYTIQPITKKVLDICEAYNARTAITINGTNYDYANSSGKVNFIIGGHIHADTDGTIQNIPYVTTLNLSGTNSNTGRNCTFDLCIADFDAHKLLMHRVGNGNNREINIL